MELIIASFVKFYFTDWIGMFCQFLGMFLLARKNKTGFLIFGTGNVSWIGYAFITGSLPQVFANFVVMLFNVYGFWSWSQDRVA